MVQVVEKIIEEKSVAHQNLAKSNKRQVVAVQGIPKHRKENRMQRSIFITVHVEITDGPEASFSEQLYFHT